MRSGVSEEGARRGSGLQLATPPMSCAAAHVGGHSLPAPLPASCWLAMQAIAGAGPEKACVRAGNKKFFFYCVAGATRFIIG